MIKWVELEVMKACGFREVGKGERGGSRQADRGDVYDATLVSHVKSQVATEDGNEVERRGNRRYIGYDKSSY